MGKTAEELGKLSRRIAVELVGTLIGVLLVGSFAADHIREPQFFLPAVALWVYAIGLIVANIRQIARIKALDYDEPVAAIETKLEALRVLRFRTVLASLAVAPLMWVPLVIVALRALGIDAYAATNAAWLVTGVVCGLAVIPPAMWIARRYRDQIAGHEFAAAVESLDSLRRFSEDR
ncbi:MAG: hypothetical protein JO101_09615 [Candidatus Eremiobacteraeota bacterium]|nr:hypothetical protein [Candidatus Eremiobacteraeota bacterium]